MRTNALDLNFQLLVRSDNKNSPFMSFLLFNASIFHFHAFWCCYSHRLVTPKAFQSRHKSKANQTSKVWSRNIQLAYQNNRERTSSLMTRKSKACRPRTSVSKPRSRKWMMMYPLELYASTVQFCRMLALASRQTSESVDYGLRLKAHSVYGCQDSLPTIRPRSSNANGILMFPKNTKNKRDLSSCIASLSLG